MAMAALVLSPLLIMAKAISIPPLAVIALVFSPLLIMAKKALAFSPLPIMDITDAILSLLVRALVGFCRAVNGNNNATISTDNIVRISAHFGNGV